MNNSKDPFQIKLYIMYCNHSKINTVWNGGMETSRWKDASTWVKQHRGPRLFVLCSTSMRNKVQTTEVQVTAPTPYTGSWAKRHCSAQCFKAHGFEKIIWEVVKYYFSLRATYKLWLFSQLAETLNPQTFIIFTTCRSYFFIFYDFKKYN